jgi:hypothetical protein
MLVNTSDVTRKDSENFATEDHSEGSFLIDVEKCVEKTAEARAASRRTVQEVRMGRNEANILFKSKKFIHITRM